MNDERESLLTKIRKLKALADDDAITEQEAANYASKMAKLMTEHAVAEHELGAAAELDRIGVNFGQKYFDSWRLMIITECSTDCGTYVIMYRKARPEPYFRIYGRPEAIEACWEMFKWLEAQIVRISREMYSQTKLSRQAQKGLAMGVAEKMGILREERKEEWKETTGTALIVLDTEQDLAKAAMTLELGEPKKTKRRQIQLTEAVAQGYRAADQVQINRRIEEDG